MLRNFRRKGVAEVGIGYKILVCQAFEIGDEVGNFLVSERKAGNKSILIGVCSAPV